MGLGGDTDRLIRILQQNSLAQHWARDWCALALTQVHHKKQDLVYDKKCLLMALSTNHLIEKDSSFLIKGR